MIVIMGMRMVAYAPIMAVGGVIKVIRTNVSMTWIIALAVAVIAVVLALLLRIAMPRFNLRQKLVDRLNLVSREVLTGLPVIRAFGTEQREIGRFGKANTDLMQTALFVNRAMGMMTPVMNLVMNGTTLMIVWFGAAQILRGSIQVGTMMATKAKGPRYLEMAEGYVTRCALDEDNLIIGYEFINLGKMMDFIKKGDDANTALEKAKGSYGRFAGAAKYIDPRHE